MLDTTYEDTWNTREERLRELGMSYKEFLLSDTWKAVKLKASSRKNYQTCEFCDCTKVELHHSSYKWLGTKDELRTVYACCRYHHELIHKMSKELNISVRLSTNYFRNYKNRFRNKKITKIACVTQEQLEQYLKVFNRTDTYRQY